MKNYVSSTLNSNEINIIEKSYRCSFCWGKVRVYDDGGQQYISCDTEGCSTKGMVKESFVLKSIEQNRILAIKVKKLYLTINGYEWLFTDDEINNMKKDKKEKMKELGF